MAETTSQENEEFFENINPDTGITQIESMCVNCERNGITKFMLTKIPFFREIIISYFECKHCGYRNNAVDSAGRIQDKGVRISVRCKSAADLNRTVVKSDTATVRVPELELEIPANTQKGMVNTIEGVLLATHEGISKLQEERRKVDPEAAAKIDKFLDSLLECARAERTFVFILDDPAGNSFIQNPHAPHEDPEMIITHYERSREQNEALGISEEEELREQERRRKEAEGYKWLEEQERRKAMAERPADLVGIQSFTEPGSEFSRPAGSQLSVLRNPQTLQELTTAMTAEDLEKDVVRFMVPCPQCASDSEQRMVKINIPYFKEVIVMALVCTKCNYRNSEIKVGGAISPKGRRIRLLCKTPEDLSRDVLKSDTATLTLPELDFTLNQYGSMGGRFTTVEGLLTTIRKELSENPFAVGDSSDRTAKENFNHFLSRLDSFLAAKEPFTVEIDDPVANSYVQSLTAPAPDPQLIIEDYTRTPQQDDELGLNDMKTEGYYEEETSTTAADAATKPASESTDTATTTTTDAAGSS